MNKFQPHILPVYPPHNELIFEEWLSQTYRGCDSDRHLIPAHFTAYWVNNDYGNNARMKQEMQEFIDSLDRGKKWFTVIQYDDGALIDFKDLDVLQFNMSKNVGITMPLLCQPHPHRFIGSKKWFANFVGSKTHPIRNSAEAMKKLDGYYISFEQHNIEQYCRIMHESMFTLCYRGYGLNSFRIAEAIQYGSIPVYISDEYILPYDINFEYYGILIHASNVDCIDEMLQSIEPVEVIKLQERLYEVYEKYYTYEGNIRQIIRCLEDEYYRRQSVREIA